jgi:hypothetical protein
MHFIEKIMRGVLCVLSAAYFIPGTFVGLKLGSDQYKYALEKTKKIYTKEERKPRSETDKHHDAVETLLVLGGCGSLVFFAAGFFLWPVVLPILKKDYIRTWSNAA